ncbi:FAD/NAD P-binding domain-containing protein [Gloeophyllum trabeum ATCC 11539]|uniref:Electron transfer flavoprotein-ubiquinone oxidoreductase n=1 Tax=Gloeophyllum trabeum (strain ATCC 11539 / FP-39264 / Madison 617) TaxID=670483 RepID=S7PQQ2_GLOTA|nr:FAD/NAD P-binding domain-containing protein [Gloeophyllum trabeum ATCC 11539]EPQ50141.1 FAD/NAD P-binding domain-containing protein [Gloeophyllum trabeum ATCC 11539]
MLRSGRYKSLAVRQLRFLHSSARCRRELFDPNNVERPSDEVDVCIVGGGPAGLSAAIRLKQLEQEKGREVRVVVLEKGAEIGSHIVSGAVIEPRALNELLPSWSERDDHPLTQPALSSSMRFLTPTRSFPMPHPPQMSNKGNYILSLSRFTAWLGGIAEELGVEVYPGFAGAGVVYSADGKSVLGVRTNEVGLDRQGRMKETFEPGMEFRARVTLLAEGAHGSLTKEVCKRFELRKESDPQTYGIGLKEVWRVDPAQYRPGEVVHTMGWPLDAKTYGGGWVYHMADGLVSLGLVVGLDYANPYLSPYNELQRMKHHPYFEKLLSGDATRIAYAARTLNEGGLQSVPRLHFPGGALIGCSAGFVNVPKIKGTHNAMKSGMLAAEAAFAALESPSESEAAVDMSAYEAALKESWVWKELHEVRNLRPSFNTPLGIWGGLAYSGLDTFVLKGRTPWTFRNRQRTTDAAHTKPTGAPGVKPIQYPPFRPPLSTDLLTSLALTGTNHAEDQPVHLRVTKEGLEGAEVRKEHVRRNVGEFAGLLGRACPAGVYEYVEDEEKAREAGWEGKALVINSQNCIHCKLCDIKVPTQDINWTVPEGGGGPKYTIT